jgi:FdhD protein
MTDVSRGTQLRPLIKVVGREVMETEDLVIEEAPLTVYLNGKELVTMLCTPGEERFLVQGFLTLEGMIKTTADITKMTVDIKQGIVWVDTLQGNTPSEKLFLKRYLTACCGKGSTAFYFANDTWTAKKVTGEVKITPQEVYDYSRALNDASEIFKMTGGVHSGAIAAGGRFIYYSHDIGRHNVFDKLYGHCLLDELPLEDKVIVFSGRVSAEIVLKVSKMNMPMIISRAAPTTLALDLAEELGVTVIGFSREERLNVYTHAHRVVRE